jgi:hypothetical protein
MTSWGLKHLYKNTEEWRQTDFERYPKPKLSPDDVETHKLLLWLIRGDECGDVVKEPMSVRGVSRVTASHLPCGDVPSVAGVTKFAKIRGTGLRPLALPDYGNFTQRTKHFLLSFS